MPWTVVFDQAREPDDLAAAQHEVRRARASRAPRQQALDAQRHLLGRRGARREHRLDRAADHLGDDPRGVVLARGSRRDRPAVAEHRDVVGEGRDLVEQVGDVDDGGAAVRDRAHDAVQRLELVAGEHRGRLVEDEDPAAPHRAAGDLDELLVGQGELPGADPRVDVVEADAIEGLAGDLAPSPVRADARDALVAEEDVVLHAHLREHRELLVDGRDAPRESLARVGEPDPDAVEDLHEGRLARAVLAEQGVDATRSEADAHVVERDDARERLAQPERLKRGWSLRHHRPPFDPILGCCREFPPRSLSDERSEESKGHVSRTGALRLGFASLSDRGMGTARSRAPA